MISALEKVMRPLVEFDVNNSEHRQMYFEFIRTRSWGNCPYRFNAAGYGNTKGVIDNQLLEYYLKREFDSQ